MDFSDPPRRIPAGNLLPMINVVFLLLIFFLLAARIAPQDAISVTPPDAATGATGGGDFTLLIGADGRLAYRDITGEAALQALAADRSRHCADHPCAAKAPALLIRADRAVPAARVAALMPRIGAAGFAEIKLVTARP